MRIKVRTEDAKFKHIFPNFFVFIRLTWSIISKAVAGQLSKSSPGIGNINIDSAMAGQLMAELRRIKRRYGRFTLVDVESADGDIVKIIL